MTRSRDRHGQVRVTVTERHINNAIPRDSAHCMIADALKAALPDAVRIAVDLQTIRWTEPARGKRYVCFTPASGQRALLEFDQGRPVVPFNMQLRPVQILPAGGSDQRRPREIQPAKPPDANGAGHQSSPVVKGGKPLPTGALSNRKGRRREYGLRQTQR